MNFGVGCSCSTILAPPSTHSASSTEPAGAGFLSTSSRDLSRQKTLWPEPDVTLRTNDSGSRSNASARWIVPYAIEIVEQPIPDLLGHVAPNFILVREPCHLGNPVVQHQPVDFFVERLGCRRFKSRPNVRLKCEASTKRSGIWSQSHCHEAWLR